MPRNKKSKKTVDEKISEALGVAETKALVLPTPHNPQAATEPVEGVVVDAEIVVRKDQPLALGYPTPDENPDIEADYTETRKHLQDVREQAVEALEQMKDVAEQGSEARQYEVVGQLIKMNLDAAKAQLELHKDMKELREPGKGRGPRQAHIGDVNNSVYVGTTDDLLRLKKAGKLPKEETK